jgi:predicted porin
MNKNLMALAVAGVLAAPAAALAQVEIGGGINLLYYQHDPKNASTGSKTDIMDSSESELNIRGEDKLGGGMSAWFQCATSIDGIFNGNSASASSMCTRNSALGFKGGFGNVFFGNWDTPSKLVQNQIRGWFSGTNALYGGGFTLLAGGASSGQTNPVQTTVASPVIGAVSGAATANGGNQAYSFYRRQANSLNYHSPNWGAFTLQAAYSTGNEGTGFADTATPKLKPRLGGLAGNFNMGPLWVGLAFEQHKDYNPGNLAQSTVTYNGGTDNNTTLGVGYTFAGRFKLRGGYSESKYEVVTGTAGAQELKVKGWAIYSENNISGPHSINLAYIRVNDTTGTSTNTVGSYRGTAASNCGISGTASCASNTGAAVFNIAYAYQFSKRTQGLIAYDEMKNKDNAQFNMGKVASSWGGKQSSVGIAVRHSF